MPLQSRPVVHGHCKFGHEIRPRSVGNGVDRVETQSVEIEFVQPVKRVVNEEITYDARAPPVEIDRRAPWRGMRRIEELRRIRGEIVSFRPEMVVDHVEEDHQPPRMRRRHQALEILRRTVGGIRREQQNPVISPVALAGKIRHRHEFDRSHAQAHQIVQPLDGGIKRPLRGEGADVQFIDHGLFPWTTTPILIRPFERVRIDYHAWRMHVLRVVPRCRIGHIDAIVDAKRVRHSGRDGVHRQRVPAVSGGRHRNIDLPPLVRQIQPHRGCTGCP